MGRVGPRWHAWTVPTQLTPADHLEGLRAALLAFVRYAERAGLAAPVPTCPGWTVRDLVAHTGMVHRWAAASLRGEILSDAETQAFETDGLACPDALEWLRDGAIEFVQAFTDCPDDAEAPVFLRDAPSPRAFWARRQCHETTIHAVDALCAALGRAPRGEDTWLTPELARDGIDELLGGFLTRRRSRLRSDEPGVLVVAPDDAGEWWEVAVGAEPAVTTRRAGAPEEGDWELTGGSADLYVRLWNRGPDAAPLPGWRDLTAVTWG